MPSAHIMPTPREEAQATAEILFLGLCEDPLRRARALAAWRWRAVYAPLDNTRRLTVYNCKKNLRVETPTGALLAQELSDLREALRCSR